MDKNNVISDFWKEYGNKEAEIYASKLMDRIDNEQKIKNMNREIKTYLYNILDLIVSAKDYGFERDVLFHSFSNMLGKKLSNEEIESYARLIESIDRYNQEDYFKIKKRLKDFKTKYCK